MTWDRVAFRDLGQWFGGATPSKAEPTFWTGGSIPWLSPKDMGPVVLAGTKDRISEDAVAGSNVRVVRAHSVAVVVRSGILERTLPVSLVPFETTLNQDMKAVVPRAGIDPRWIAWGIRAYERELLGTTRKAGTTVASIDMARFLRFQLPVPELAEQRRIVELLEEHLASLDAAGGSLQDACRRLETLRAAALHTCVVGPTVLLGDVALERGYGTSTKCVVDGPGLPVARIPNLIRGRLDMSDEKRAASLEDDLSRLLVRRGDLLIIRTNGSRALIGRAAVIEQDAKIAFASYLIRYRLDTTRMSPAWALAALESPRVREAIEAAAASSAGQYNLSIAKLDALQVPCPDLENQGAALAWLERIDAEAWRLNQAIDNLASRSSSLRRAALTAAFEGKLTGRHVDADVIEEMANV